ncbi:hypothetical protein REPUB_Repub02eG0032000 [Reevesia pubescens]
MEDKTCPFKIILGSSSIARRKILAEMGYEFTLMGIRKEMPEELVMAIAEAKAEAILQRLPVGGYVKEAEPTLLITSDQVVVYEGVVREKPANEEEALEFIRGYSGGHAATLGSVVVTNLKTRFRKREWDRVEVFISFILGFNNFAKQDLIEEWVVLHVAGGLIIEHPLIKPYVKQVVGKIDSVIGLPKALIEKLIKKVL